MQPAGRNPLSVLGALTVVALLLLALALPAAAGAKRGKITGKLTKRGYTVIALAENGKAKTERAPKGKFKLKPPAKKVTLHLRAPDGTYAGPIVVGTRKKGKRAIEGIVAKRNVKLHKVKVQAKKGYAKAKVRKKARDKKREALAKKGVPIGADNFGRVRVKKVKDRVPGDLDRDGVADPLDVDDDGDLILDEVDPKPRGKAAGAGKAHGALNIEGPRSLGTATELVPFGTEPLNANLPGVTKAQIDAALKANGSLSLYQDLGGDPQEFKIAPSAELDCRGLSYCMAGGTGGLRDSQFDADPDPFPACCDADGDGLGDFRQATPGVPDDLAIGPLAPNATSDEIAAGDVFVAQVHYPDGQTIETTTTLQTVFATYPLIASYTDELGVTREVSYPPTGLLSVVDGPDADSDVEVTLNVWRPQRRAIPEEAQSGNDWIDVGGLEYGVNGGGPCPESSYAESDPNLSLSTGKAREGGRLTDSAPDAPPNPTRTFTFTLNLSDCLAANGSSFGPVGEAYFGFGATLPDFPNAVNYQIGFQRMP